MCGFVAELARRDDALNAHALETATDLLAHRGPDDRALFTDGPFGVGFRRLSIFDLSHAASQPMVSQDGRHVIAFNGAIYNWPELREELRARGRSFRTHGDTEVLLTAWQEWGPGCLARLNGMFAFIVWDRHERRLYGARDRFGVKPLFWYRDGESFRLASEIKALRCLSPASRRGSIDWNTVAAFLVNDQLDAGDATFFEGIHHVPAGTWFAADPSGRVVWSKWWDLDEAVSSLSDVRQPAEEFAALFEDAVRLRMRGDVRVGVLLSGGLDSTSIACAMTRIASAAGKGAPDAFSYPSDDPAHDESDNVAATIAQTGSSLERVTPTPGSLWNSMERHLWLHDEPVYSMSSLVSEHLVHAARSRDIKVLLNGQGADEILAGYPSYFSVHWSELLRSGRFARAATSMRAFSRAQPLRSTSLIRAALRDAASRSVRRIPGSAWLMARHRQPPQGADWFDPQLTARAGQDRPTAPTTLDGALRTGLERSNLPIYLRQEDRNAMAHGVEARLPFLDHRLVTLAFKLPVEWKLASPYGKVLLRESMRGRIPELVRTQVRKLGFPTPLDTWLRGPLYEPMRDLLASREFRECGIWRPDRVIEALASHRSGRESVGSRLFDVAQTCAWLRIVESGVPPRRTSLPPSI